MVTKTGPSNVEAINPENVLALAAQDLACYTQLMQPQLQLAPHSVALIDRFEMVERRVAALPALAAHVGQATGIQQFRPSREIWQLPPQYGKTTLAQLAVSWFLGRHPDLTIIWASYGAALAEDSGKRIRTYLSDPLHRACFPDCEIAADSAAQDRIGLTAGGGAFFVGREGAITGRSATGLLLLDDMLKGREEADSSTIRENLKKWFQQVAFTRLAANAGCILIGTPWHQDDLLGWLPREFPEQGWHVLRLPALAEEDDALGRPPGAPLWPQKHDAAQLESIRQQMGSQAFVSLMQLRPSAASGTVFKREWLRLLSPPWPAFQKIIQSWDCAFGKSAKSGDYSVCVTVGVNDNGAHVLHLWRGRPDFPSLKRKVEELAREWRVSEILVEDTGAGTSLAQEFAQGWEGFDVPRLIPREARQAKKLRAELVSPMVENGKVFFADGPWMHDLVDELTAFPGGVHDDQVDALTQALAFVRDGYSSGPAVFQIVPRVGPMAWLRAALSTPPSRAYYDPRGFWEPRPVLPQVAHELTGEAAEASRRIAEGNSRPDDIDKVMEGSLGDL